MTEELPTRWEIELEFVQALSNLQYLNYLAQNKYLESEEFLNYLKYLEYWRRPEYARHLVYPNCLHVLTLLQSEQFRQQILRQDAAGVLMNDMVDRWKEPQTTFAATPLQDQKKETDQLANGNGHDHIPQSEEIQVKQEEIPNGNGSSKTLLNSITNNNTTVGVSSTEASTISPN